MYDFDPIVWYIHFRKIGDRLGIARSVKAPLDVTSTPFPQTMLSNRTTPLPAERIGHILGASPNIGSDSVVTYEVPRNDPIRLAGVPINPYLNVATSSAFEPLGKGRAAAIPDFGMVALEINPVMKVMRKQGRDIGCLQPGDGRGPTTILLSSIQERRSTSAPAGDPQRLELMNMRFE